MQLIHEIEIDLLVQGRDPYEVSMQEIEVLLIKKKAEIKNSKQIASKSTVYALDKRTSDEKD